MRAASPFVLLVLGSCGTELDVGPDVFYEDEVNIAPSEGSGEAIVSPPPAGTPCGRLPAGSGLSANTVLTSCDGRWSLNWQGQSWNLNGILIRDATAYSALQLAPHMVAHPAGQLNLLMNTEGELTVVDEAKGYAVWSSGTRGNRGAFAELTNDGRLRVKLGSTVLWTTVAPWPVSAGGRLVALQGMGGGAAALLSEGGGRFRLVLGGDIKGFGEIKIVDTQTGRTTWRQVMPRYAHFAFMQADGNFVVRDLMGTAMWASNTAGNSGAHLTMQADGNLVVYVGVSAKWASNSAVGTLSGNENNIGRSEKEARIIAASARPDIRNRCQDLQEGLSNANSRVLAGLKTSPNGTVQYTQQDLESRTLWQRLDATIAAKGGCLALLAMPPAFNAGTLDGLGGDCNARWEVAPVGPCN